MSTGMLTMAAPSSTGGTPAVVTDGGGAVDVRHTISAVRYSSLASAALKKSHAVTDILC